MRTATGELLTAPSERSIFDPYDNSWNEGF